jgi:hypothetical protein
LRPSTQNPSSEIQIGQRTCVKMRRPRQIEAGVQFVPYSGVVMKKLSWSREVALARGFKIGNDFDDR